MNPNPRCAVQASLDPRSANQRTRQSRGLNLRAIQGVLTS